MKESNVQNLLRLKLANEGYTLFRNNQGAYKHKDGYYVKYGVGGDGGSDLIGWKTIKVTQDMVGEDIAIFAAVEVKAEKGKRSPEQINFINQVKKSGGIAFFSDDFY